MYWRGERKPTTAQQIVTRLKDDALADKVVATFDFYTKYSEINVVFGAIQDYRRAVLDKIKEGGK